MKIANDYINESETKLNAVLKAKYKSADDKRKAVRNVLSELFNSGWSMGYHDREIDSEDC